MHLRHRRPYKLDDNDKPIIIQPNDQPFLPTKILDITNLTVIERLLIACEWLRVPYSPIENWLGFWGNFILERPYSAEDRQKFYSGVSLEYYLAVEHVFNSINEIYSGA